MTWLEAPPLGAQRAASHAEAVSHLDLPADRPAPPLRTGALGLSRVTLSPETARGLTATRAGPPERIVIAAWVALLGRLSGQACFPLDLFAEGGGRRTLTARLDEDAPGRALIEALGSDGAGHAASARPAGVAVAVGEVAAALLGAPEGGALLAGQDLTLLLAWRGDTLELGVAYALDRIDPARAERAGGQLQVLLSGLLQDPDRPLGELPLLTAAELRQLEAWNDTARAPEPAQALHAQIAAQAHRTPGAVAVRCGAERLRYGELLARSDALAAQLGERGVGPGARVAVLMDRCVALVVAIVGVLRAGAAYVPVDPGWPAERARYVLEDASPRVVLTASELRSQVGADWEVICVDALKAVGGAPVAADGAPSELAYVMYTSGSTGKPKGVRISHHALCNFAFGLQEVAPLGPEDAVVALAPFTFDISVAELLVPLAHGAQVLVAQRGLAADARRLIAWMRAEGATVLSATPTTLQLLLAEGWAGDPAMRVLSGGEALPLVVAQGLAGRVAALINAYGPTETTVWSSYWTARAPVERVLIGPPKANTRFYVLDARQRPLPVGVPGELYIGGHGVAMGYQGRPKLTAERFLPDPLSPEPGARMYRTGDLARWVDSGEVEYLGRLDHQVKIRGHRIELGEIEAVIGAAEEVGAVVVVAREDRPGDKQLVAYVTPAGAGVDPEALRARAAAALPSYMVPARWVRMQTLPLNSNGKVDRGALPPPDSRREGQPLTAAQSADEALVMGLFAEVLGLDVVGRAEDFFALGGHSLLALALAVRLRAALGVELPLRELFLHPSPAALAKRVRAVAGEVRPIEIVDRTQPLLPSSAQQRMCFLDALQPGSATYNLPIALRLDGPVEVDALRAALRGLVRRHEALRTCFPEVDGQRLQRVGAAWDPLQEVERVAPGGSVDACTAEEASAPFDLARGPLLRARLLRLHEDAHVLLLTLHHAVFDGWSEPILLEELGALYEAALDGVAPALPALPLQPADLAAWERRALSGARLASLVDWWRQELDGLEPLDLPTDHPRPAQASHRGQTLPVAVPAETVAGLRGLAAAAGATLFMALCAALQLLLARLCGVEDVAIGTPIANRVRQEMEPVVGFFVNTLVLRAQVPLDQGFTALLSEVKRRALGAYAHQELPFERLVDELGVARSLDRAPLFGVMLALEASAPAAPTLRGVGCARLPSAPPTAKFDLTLSLYEDAAGGLRGGLEYATDLWDADGAARIRSQLLRLLDAVVETPERPVGRLPLLGPEERARVLALGEGPRRPRSGPPTLHGLIAAQVDRSPEALALVADGGRLSYAALWRRARRWARRVEAAGVRPGDLVGIALERGEAMLTGILGVLEAGAAYLPIDPTLPPARARFFLDDARPRLVLCAGADASRFEGAPTLAPEALEDSALADAALGGEALAGAALGGEALAYCLYTSGSTGQPKGSLIAHDGVVNLVWDLRERFGLGPGAVALAATTLSFDVSVAELFAPLAWGATVVLVPERLAADGARLAQRMAAEGVNRVCATPTALQLWLAAGWRGGPELWVMSAGEPLPRDLALRLKAHCGRVINAYGPTEATVYTSYWEVPEAVDRVRIGRPGDNVQVRVLDPQGAPQALGVPGELVIGGVGVANGYLGRAELSAARFVPDPFSAEPGARMYRSGDRARLMPNGELEYLGRLDGQVKVRGYRIEPGEIEAALLASGPLVAAAVIVREDSPGQRRLVAYVVPRAGARVDTEALHEALAARLPAYMLPAAWVPMEALPQTSSGKVDRRALPAPSGQRAPRARAMSPLEARLCGLFAALLGLDAVGPDEDFFRLGGESILALQLSARAAREGLRFTVRELFLHPSPARLARVAREEAPPAAAEVLEGPVPLSPIQRWLLEQPGARAEHFNQATVMQLDPALTVEALESALAAVHGHHPVFRLRLSTPDGPLTPAAAGPDYSLSREALGADPGALERRADALHEGFSLSEGPLSRLLWLDRPGAPPLLLWVIHHLLVDGVSWRILGHDLEEACAATMAGRAPALAPAPCGSGRWAQALSAYAQTPASEDELPRWLHTLACPARLPGRGGGEGTGWGRALSALAPGRSDAAQRAAARFGANLGELLLTALLRVFAAELAGPDLRVALESHGRDPGPLGSLDLSRAVGWFTALYPARLPLRASSGPAHLVAVKEAVRATPWVGLGFGVLRYLRRSPALLDALRAGGPSELVFNYLGRLDDGLRGGRWLRWSPAPSGQAEAPDRARAHRLEINAHVAEGQLHVEWSWSRAALDEAQVRGWMRALEGQLTELVAACAREAGRYTPSDFPGCGLGAEALAESLARLGARGRAGVEDLFPLTPMQQAMLISSQEQPELGVYYEQLTLRLTGALDVGAMQRAWQRALDEAPALRMAFDLRAEPPVQAVMARATLPFTVEDLRGAPDPEGALEALRRARRLEGMALASAPLLRVDLRRLGAAWAVVVGFHHALLDGWSVQRLLARVGEAYAAFARGEAPTPAPGRSLRDHMERVAGRDVAAARAWFEAELGSFSAPTPLPGLGGPRAELRRVDEPSIASRALSEADSDALRALCRRLGVTLSDAAQLAWAVTLARLSGSDDVVFGVTLAGRSEALPGVEERLGLFINTLPLRVQLAQDRAVTDALMERRRALAELQAHALTPLSEARRASGVPGGQRLFDSVLVVESYPVALGEAWGGLRLQSLRFRERTELGLTLAVHPGRRVQADLVWEPSRFEAGLPERVLGCFLCALAELPRRADQPLRALRLLNEADEEALRALGRGPAPPPGRHAWTLFAEAAEAHPDQLALEDGALRLSYRALKRQAEALGAALRAEGVGPEVVVATRCGRGAEGILGFLGALAAGGACLPIDPELPRARVAWMLQDAGAARLLTTEALAASADFGLPTHTLSARAAPPPAAPLPALSRSLTELAYVIYTSGSTGAPKGVEVEHRGVSALVAAQAEAFGIGPGARVLQLASPAFDASVAELLVTLCSGGTLVLLPDGAARDPAALGEALRERRVDVATLPPALLPYLDPAEHPGLRTLVVAGEACAPDVLAPWLSGRRVINAYGPTEATVCASMQLCDITNMPPQIGRPLPGAQLQVLDPAGAPCPLGVPGELVIGGVGVARGYRGRPALTAERFVADPRDDAPEARAFRSGDWARWLPGGSLEFLGRLDEQLKIHGVRVEPGEIEARLRSHPAVARCAVVGQEDGAGARRLVAFVVPAPGARIEAGALRAHLARTLPAVMLPSAWVSLEALPRNSSGKVDRAALKRQAPAPLAEVDEAPQGPVEAALAGIFASALGLPAVGRSADFYALGGDSLRAMAVVHRAERAGLSLRLPLLQAHPTPAGLAARLAGGDRAGCLSVLRAGDARRALVLLPPAGGLYVRVHALARALQTEAAIYGLVSPHLAGGAQAPARLPALVDRYAAELIEVLGDRALTLLGYSFGGVTALELVAPLRAAGVEVEAVLLVDNPAPSDRPSSPFDPRAALRGFVEALGLDPDLDGPDPVAAAAAAMTPAGEDGAALTGFVSAMLESARFAHAAMAGWQPSVPAAPVHRLYVPSGGEGWPAPQHLASAQELVGTHDSALRPPHLAENAARISRLLR